MTAGGRPCGRHLLDIDEDSDASLIVNCRNKEHRGGQKRAILLTVSGGTLKYEILPSGYRKRYTIGGAHAS